jgi:hypothetical protein
VVLLISLISSSVSSLATQANTADVAFGETTNIRRTRERRAMNKVGQRGN